MRSLPSPPVGGPTSYQSACRAVRTSTAVPWPTSCTSSSSSPAAGACRAGHSSGRHSSRPARPPPAPRGSSHQNTPSKATGSAQRGASASHHIACGCSANGCRASQLSSNSQAAARQAQRPAPSCSTCRPVPSSDSGTTSIVHHGMIGRLTSGPSRAVPPNKAMHSGSSPRLATPCAARNPRSPPPIPSGPVLGRHQSSHSTPPKLSQNPAESTDSGAGNSITIAANASPCPAPTGRRPALASATSPIISAARTVGSAPPAATA